MTTTEQKPAFEGWAILELLGHRRLGGYVTEVQLGGSDVLRIDIPETSSSAPFTQFYGGGSLYCLTPTSEAVARAVAERSYDRPVQSFEVPQLAGAHEEGPF